MAQTSSIALLQTVSSFYSTIAGDTGPNLIKFKGVDQYFGAGGGGYVICSSFSSSSATAQPSIITLPNGSRFDPHQTYAGPQTPGIFTVSVTLIPNRVAIAAGTYTLNQTESAIQYYHRSAMYLLNRQGELTGANADEDVTTATARLIGIDASWGMPKQIPTTLGGVGQNTRGVESMNLTFTFDMLTKWSW